MDLQPMASGPIKLQTSPLSAPLIPGSPYSVLVLQEGYSTELPDGSTRADGTISLVLGPHLTLVDTGGPWDRERLLAGLAKQGVSPSDIRHVVCTHGHSDHVGNLNLFSQADLIVGTDLSRPDGCYLPTGLRQGVPYVLHDGYLEVLPTPGHSGNDISLMVRGTSLGHVLLAGDLFEHDGDDGEWQPLSQDPVRQEVLVPAIHIQATGRRGCCGNRCGMFISVLFAAVGLAGSLYAISVSALGLVRGPLCRYMENETLSDWQRPFFKEDESLSEDNYLFDQDLWDICRVPEGVTEFNVILFSIILGSGAVELVLCGIQVINGLFGCLCGTMPDVVMTEPLLMNDLSLSNSVEDTLSGSCLLPPFAEEPSRSGRTTGQHRLLCHSTFPSEKQWDK